MTIVAKQSPRKQFRQATRLQEEALSGCRNDVESFGCLGLRVGSKQGFHVFRVGSSLDFVLLALGTVRVRSKLDLVCSAGLKDDAVVRIGSKSVRSQKLCHITSLSEPEAGPLRCHFQP